MDAESATQRPALKAAAPARRAKSRLSGLLPKLIGGALVLLLVSAFWPRALEVEIAEAKVGPMTVSVFEEGKTRIRQRYVVSPPVAGFLQRIEHRAGARIEAGKTVLAVLTPEPSSILNPRARAEAEARVQAAEAAKQAKAAQLERSRAQLGLAERDLARSRELKKSGAIAARDFDNAESQAAMLEREQSMAAFGLRTAEFELAQARAALLQAQTPAPANGGSFEPLQILAPVDGVILRVIEENARVVPAATPLLEVGDPRDMEAEIELLSADAAGVRVGADVSIEHWGGDRPLRARVAMVEPGGYTKVSSLGVEEQRVKVRVDFVEQPPAGFLVGDRFRVEARITTWQADAVLQVPAGALFRRGSEWMTFVVQGSTARLQKVDIGHLNGTSAEVKGGLERGARVVVHPPDALENGKSVRARK
ncbi:MAG: HlyD family efflux transporter periplasmic adaptor subunit [Verrucomicrobia bacterium]|nr:HlyD family efflux transporter periplasmic adaptor subunit [Verrucomicrobiota bacterium]